MTEEAGWLTARDEETDGFGTGGSTGGEPPAPPPRTEFPMPFTG